MLLWRASSTKPPLQPNKVDKKHEKDVGAQQFRKADPEEVSTESTVVHAFQPSQQAGTADTPGPISQGVVEDLDKVKDTFSLRTVPRLPLRLGLAGTLPYLATSLSTMYLSWDMNAKWPTDSNLVNSFMVSHDSAAQWLHLLEPLQLGYGAVIISFLGAIHWGLEFAERKTESERARFRYGVGVVAPAVAWPTLLMPVEWALTTQFLAFTMLYFADARACARGWTPAWYATYRFVLTFVVGGAILISLVGRAKIGEGDHSITTAHLRKSMHKGDKSTEKYVNWAKLEEEEKEKKKKEKEEEEKSKKDDKKKGKKDGEEKSKDDDQSSEEGKDKKDDDDAGDGAKDDASEGDADKESDGDKGKKKEKKD